MTTLIALDTEFTDLVNCELVSIGLVHENAQQHWFSGTRPLPTIGSPGVRLRRR